MKLVIVESPNKCDTIGRYLGQGYKVMATKGHLRDLATTGHGGFGVDIENGFKPKYVVNSDKYQTVNELKSKAKSFDEVILATDPDREGEAIAWHLTQILGLDPKKTKRLEFHEITRDSINEAMKEPRVLDMNLVASQESRRIMDRVIGFSLSGLLQRKIKSRSAGRVQSSTLKLICDHEDEILKFVPKEYWTLSLDLSLDKTKVKADFLNCDKTIKEINDEKTDKAIVARLKNEVVVKSVKKSIRTVDSKPPFTTSTLQQEAFNVYHFSTKKTSALAQALYEGINVHGEHTGLITYIRTDSTHLSDTFVNRAKIFISETFGEEYFGHRKGARVLNAQNAHEAIRPVANHQTPEKMKEYLQPDQYKLYKLIYERAIGSLMSAKKEEVTSIVFETNGVSFKCDGTRVIFDGYSRVYMDSEATKATYLPQINEGQIFKIDNINNEKQMTKPPVRYSEAKIVKLMEEKGIGRPSTYASTISTLLNRKYVTSKAGVVTPTEQGMKTSFILNKYFPNLVDAKYTALMEKDLDSIQDGEKAQIDVLKQFYYPYMDEFEDASDRMYKDLPVLTGQNCPICGAPLVWKKGKYGPFIGCSNFPDCKYRVKEVAETVYTGENCPKCGKPLVYRKNRKGKTFIACTGYPECDFTKDEVREFRKHTYTKSKNKKIESK